MNARRRFFLHVIAVLAPLSTLALHSSPSLAAEGETLLLQSPTISESHIVFVYAGDLWIVAREGGDARRLTSDVGMEGSPRLSPDGKWVAFSGQYEGNVDVYVMSIDGGTPKRLTYHPGADVVRDWHPDGKRVLFTSGRHSRTLMERLFLANVDGGLPEELPLPRVNHASYDSSAKRIAYCPYPDAFRTWKRYRGGRVTRVWIYDAATHGCEEIPAINASDTFPCWVEGTVYFASDRDNQMNLWRYTPGSGRPHQVTEFNEFDIRSMSAGDGVVVIEQGGGIHIYDPHEGLTRVKIRIRGDGFASKSRWQNVGGFVRNVAIAPNGKRAAFEARGEIITVPREHGDARNLTKSPGAHDRSPVWSPDGEKLAWFSDESGEYRLVVKDRLGQGEAKSYDLQGGGFYESPMWSPDGKHILFRDKSNRIAFITLESGDVHQVYTNQGNLGVLRASATWSPDSQWIAFEQRNPRTMYDHIALYSLESKEVTVLTDGFSQASDPAFSGDGKHLFFAASVNVGPKMFGLDMTPGASRDAQNSLYVAVLKKDGENPLFPRSDDAVSEKKDDDKKKEETDKGEKKDDADEAKDGEDSDGEMAEEEAEEEKAPSIDLEGLDQRILALPMGRSQYGGLECAGDKLLYVEFGDGGTELRSFDFKSRESKSVTSGVFGFYVSHDGKHVLTQGSGGYQIMGPDGSKKKSLNINNVQVRVDPAQEWPQILREAWRIERDYFYDPQMHGVDWDKMWDRWSPFLSHVRHRSDLNVVLMEMIGELACGHNYVSGGEMPRADSGPSVGLLGANYTLDSGRYKIERILKGQNWNTRLRAPLTEPGVDVQEGDYLISVDGRDVSAADNIHQVLEATANRQVTLGVSKNADGTDTRFSQVVPIGSESRLRLGAWVEDNRQRVDKMSGGRLAYVYMPDTGGGGQASFDRDFYSQIDKEGLVLDERFNRGGKVADYVIHVLGREVMCYWMNREQWVAQSPFGTLDGPKCMIVNERSGSGGDCMPWMFKNQGLGKLVGRRTWGGLVGISGYPPLMDGGGVTAASFGVMDTNGDWAVENVGVAPDVEVVQWPKDIIEGRDPQLEKAIAIVLGELETREKRARPTYKPPTKR